MIVLSSEDEQMLRNIYLHHSLHMNVIVTSRYDVTGFQYLWVIAGLFVQGTCEYLICRAAVPNSWKWWWDSDNVLSS